MTICIPKKPFKVLGLVVGHFLLWSWIPLLIIGIYGLVIWNVDYISGIAIFWTPLIGWCWWFIGYNDKHKVIQWCDSTQQKNQEVKG